MPQLNGINAVEIYTESILRLMNDFIQSPLANSKPSLNILYSLLDGVLVTNGFVPLTKSQLNLLKKTFSALLKEWPKEVTRENHEWFKTHILAFFTDPIIQSETLRSYVTLSPEEEAALRVSLMKRLGKLLQTCHLKSDLHRDLELCLRWCETSDSERLLDDLRQKFKHALEKKCHRLKNQLLSDVSNQHDTSHEHCFSVIAHYVRHVRRHYLFNTIQGTETLLQDSLRTLRQSLLESEDHSQESDRELVIKHLGLNDMQREIQRQLCGFFNLLKEHAPLDLLNILNQVLSKNYSLEGWNGLLPLENLEQNVREALIHWEPDTSFSGIKQFKSLFIDPYFKPIRELFHHYGMIKDRERTEHRLIESGFVQALLKCSINEQNDLPKEKLACLFSWLQWYPERVIAVEQNRMSQGILDDHWQHFIERLGQGEAIEHGFRMLITALSQHQVFNIDSMAQMMLYQKVHNAINSDNSNLLNLKGVVQNYYPEYLLDETQFHLFFCSHHVLEVLKNDAGTSNFGNLVETMIGGQVGRLFFDFPKCRTHKSSRCLSDIFAEESVIESFHRKFLDWTPVADEDGIEAFRWNFIAYYTIPFLCNPEWLNYLDQEVLFRDELIFSSKLMIESAIVYKIQSECWKKHPNVAREMVEKIKCLTVWINNYPESRIQEGLSKSTISLIDNALMGFTTALQKKGEPTNANITIENSHKTSLAFKALLRQIRVSIIFKSDINAEELLRAKVKEYHTTLASTKGINNNDVLKVRAAILADPRLSIERINFPKMPFKNPKETLTFLKWSTTKGQEEKKRILRSQSERVLRHDEERNQNTKKTPKHERHSKHTGAQDKERHDLASSPKFTKTLVNNRSITFKPSPKQNEAPVTLDSGRKGFSDSQLLERPSRN